MPRCAQRLGQQAKQIGQRQSSRAFEARVTQQGATAQLEEHLWYVGQQLFEAVKAARGLKYMMFETSYYHDDLHAMRTIYNAGGLGKLVYAEGEYYHYMDTPIDSYKGWRIGLPPQWYPTHSNAYFTGVCAGSPCISPCCSDSTVAMPM